MIINDGSTDKTESIVRDLMKRFKQVKLVNHKKNAGLGAALRTGFKEAKGIAIVTMDADLTHPPEMIKDLIKGLEDTDVCLASRYVGKGGMKNVPFWRVLISKIANTSFGIMYGTKIKDISSGFKAYRSEKIKKINSKAKDFSIQIEIMAHLIKNKTKFKEIPFILVDRKIGVSKFRFFHMIPKYFVSVWKYFFFRWFG